jgi:hypothetical protein
MVPEAGPTSAGILWSEEVGYFRIVLELWDSDTDQARIVTFLPKNAAIIGEALLKYAGVAVTMNILRDAEVATETTSMENTLITPVLKELFGDPWQVVYGSGTAYIWKAGIPDQDRP